MTNSEKLHAACAQALQIDSRRTHDGLTRNTF